MIKMSKYNLLSEQEREEFLKILHAHELDNSQIKNKYLNLSYGADPMQAMDIYLPDSGEKPFPTIVFIHGGGWSSGSKSDTQVMPFIRCLSHGYAVVSVEFRPTPQVKFPDNLYDIKSSLRFIGKSGEKYGIDTTRLVLAGASAGAHLALMAAYTKGISVYEGSDEPCLYNIAGVIDQFGVTDFLSRKAQFDQSGIPRFDDPEDTSATSMDILMGVGCSSIENLVRFAQPVDMVHCDIPPTLIQHGRFDPMVPYQQSTELAHRIAAVAGVDRVSLHINEDCTHGDPKFGDDKRLGEILEFLKKIL